MFSNKDLTPYLRSFKPMKTRTIQNWSKAAWSAAESAGEGEHEHVTPSNKVAKIAAGQATDANAEKSRILAPSGAQAGDLEATPKEWPILGDANVSRMFDSCLRRFYQGDCRLIKMTSRFRFFRQSQCVLLYSQRLSNLNFNVKSEICTKSDLVKFCEIRDPKQSKAHSEWRS